MKTLSAIEAGLEKEMCLKKRVISLSERDFAIRKSKVNFTVQIIQ